MEYALILSVISIVLVGVIFNVGTKVTAVYSTIDSQIANATANAASSH